MAVRNDIASCKYYAAIHGESFVINRNVASSVRARLLNHARETKQDFNLVLTRFCLERLLYRISISKYVNHFYLKGALLFDLWFDVPRRPTRDVDFLGFGPSGWGI
ncbi:nucleotidyl transferase AbiEii/AbiGii toxin family protein [Teredinibacter turnerae]|uniref:nucleotidyl transferase AbiEii/AbiGii toxin family protein n=1 Tax=Teredinibacter turnerae TaxID=2426 RepID=UPI0030B80035